MQRAVRSREITATTDIAAGPARVWQVLSDTAVVEPCGDGARLIQHEVLSGALTPLFRSMLTRETPEAFVALSEALAERVGS